MNLKRKSVVLYSAVLIVFIVTIALVLYFSKSKDEITVGPNDDPIEEIIPEIPDRERSQSIKKVESLQDVDKFFSFSIYSEEVIDLEKNYVTIYNQNGLTPSSSLVLLNEHTFTLSSPTEGYEPGDTYRVTLIDNKLTFVDESYYDLKSFTFTIYRPDIIQAIEKDEIKREFHETQYILSDEGRLVLSEEELEANNLGNGDIIILPVMDEYGFILPTAYKISGINNGEVVLEKPRYDEVFEDLIVKGSFGAVYSEEYFNFFSIDEMEQDLVESELVKKLAASSDSNKNPICKITIEIVGGGVEIEYSIEFPAFAKNSEEKKVSFFIKGIFEIQLEAIANINLVQGTFNLGSNFGYKHTYTLSIEAEWKPTGEDGKVLADLSSQANKKLEEMLNKQGEENKLNIKAFNCLLPTPVPLLCFTFTVKLVAKIEASVQVSVTFSDGLSSQFGLKRDSNGITPYFNKENTSITTGIEVRGKIEAKLGLEIEFAGNIGGIFSAGLRIELGIYAKIAGFAKAENLMDLAVEEDSKELNLDTNFCYGFSFEIGFYFEISLFAELDLVFWQYEGKVSLLEVIIPILSIGYTQTFQIIPNSNSIVFSDDGYVSLPNLTVIAKDMFTGETKYYFINQADLREVVDIYSDNQDLTNENTNLPFTLTASNDLILKDKTTPILTAQVEFRLKNWQRFVPEIEISYGIGVGISIKMDRGIFHYELGAIRIVANVTVTKEPIAPTSVSLEYVRIVEDSDYAVIHPELSAEELKYRVRDPINSIQDYQIGRLVQVIPTFTPENASYKELSYTVISGAQYIVGGVDGVEIYQSLGQTYAQFRVIENIDAIGNRSGIINPLKEIKLKAQTIGYPEKYQYMNIASIDQTGIYASSIPTVDFELSTLVNNQLTNLRNIRVGEQFNFQILPTSVFPSNATRGESAFEQLTIIADSGVTADFSNTTFPLIQINSLAMVGDQIILCGSLSGIIRYYYLQVIKTEVESIELGSATFDVSPGQNYSLEALILGKDNLVPTNKNVTFIILQGQEIGSLTSNVNNMNLRTLVISDLAIHGEIIQIVAYIDNLKSNILEFKVVKISVQTVNLIYSNSLNITRGDNLQFHSSVFPSDATINLVRYLITVGNDYAVIDSYTGLLYLSLNVTGGETIHVRAMADGVTSNEIILTVNATPVRTIQWPNYAPTERVILGESILLEVFVNADATNQGVNYEITVGPEYGYIENNVLYLTLVSPKGKYLRVKATSAEDPSIFVNQKFEIYTTLGAISVDGRVGTVYLPITSTAMMTITDLNGNILDNSSLSYRVSNDYGSQKSYLTVRSDGLLIPDHQVPEDFYGLIAKVYAILEDSEILLVVQLINPPLDASLILDSDQKGKEISLYPNEIVKLSLKVTYADNSSDFTNFIIQIQGEAEAIVEVYEIDGFLEYFATVKVKDSALNGDTIHLIGLCYLNESIYQTSDFLIFVKNEQRTIEIINAPSSLILGESYQLIARSNIESRITPISYQFVGFGNENFATLNQETGLLTIKEVGFSAESKIYVEAVMGQVFSEVYAISITDVVHPIEITCDPQSTGVHLLSDASYLLEPDATFMIKSMVIGGIQNPNITYQFDSIGYQWFNLNDNIVTIIQKNQYTNNGFSLVGLVDGQISNILTLYLARPIKTINDWYQIEDYFGGYYVLQNHLDFEFSSYRSLPYFNGILDGNGFELRNLSFETISPSNNFGLFEENYGQILNLSVRNLNAKIWNGNPDTTKFVFGIFATYNYGLIQNCESRVNSYTMIDIYYSTSIVGGIVGINEGLIIACSNYVTIRSTGIVGGIAALNGSNGVIQESWNLGSLIAPTFDETNPYLGIIVQNNGLIENSENRGKITDANRQIDL